MANEWQKKQVAFYIERAVDSIRETANKGYYSKSLEAPPMNVSRKECKKILEDLGYIVSGSNGAWNVSWLETGNDE